MTVSARFATALLGLVFVSALASGQEIPRPPLALVHANVLDVRTGKVAVDMTLVLRDGRIESVAAKAPPPDVKTLDLKGKYVVPGFIDAHVHIAGLAAARLALESGVTTARSAGVSDYHDVGLRELARKGAIAGPDFAAAGYHVRPRLAEEAFLSDTALWTLMPGVDSAEKIRQVVRVILGHGVDWIKVLATERAGTADT